MFALIALAVFIAIFRRPEPSPAFETLHPHTQQALRRLGVDPSRVAQGLGLASASAGIHGVDGVVNGRPYCAAFDLAVSDLTPDQTRILLHKLRGAGLACWWRLPGVSFPLNTPGGIENGPHIHGIDPFVPHKRRLELQIRDYLAGSNGIEIGRYAHQPDPPAACPQTIAERNLLRRMRRGQLPVPRSGSFGYNHSMRVSALLSSILLFFTLLLTTPPADADERPPVFPVFAQIETHRIRIVNSSDGAIQLSSDKGRTWHLIGRVTAPATQSLMGYSASGYAQPGTVAATAVHGLRIRVGDLSTPDPLLINILPREFAQTPVLFGGHVSGASGIYTTIPVGDSIFRELSPFVGNPVFLTGSLGTDRRPLPLNYIPHVGDVLEIQVLAPANPLKEVFFDNVAGGVVRATFTDRITKLLTHVVKPVVGIGRYDGCSYTGVGALNTNHDGVITVSTAPVSTSPLFEGIGPERRGGFQIQPAFHNAQGDGAGAPSVLVIGSRKKPSAPEMEGTPPLFDGYFNLAWGGDQPRHSWRAEVQHMHGSWQPMPTLIGDHPLALADVTALRLVCDEPGDDSWRAAQIKIAEKDYAVGALAAARAGKTPVEHGNLTLTAAAPDRRTVYVAFYVDGQFKGITNSAPYSFNWNTRQVPDGEYVIEAQTQDINNQPLSSTRTKIWVDNVRRVVKGT